MEILPGHLFLKILCEDIAQRSVTKILPQGPLQKISYRGSSRSCQETRDLVQRSGEETSFGDPVARPGEESRGLARRSQIDSLKRDLTLRSLTKIFCVDTCTNSLSQGSCTAASLQLSRSSCAPSSEDLHKGNLQNHTWYLFLSLIVSLLFCQLAASDASRSFALSL